MAGGVGSDGERPWIVVGDRLKGAKGWWRLGAVIVVGIDLLGKMTESKARVEKIPDEPWNTLLYQKEGNAQRMIKTCQKDSRRNMNGLPLAQSR